jgi:hypothetical protein
MNIGIFGDSFADAVYELRHRCWPTFVKDNLNANIGYHALSGTSVWYSYQQFKKHKHKYDVIIFSYTSNSRWPHLSNELNGKEYNVGIHKDNDDFINKIAPLFFTLFSDELLLFLNSNIQRSIVEECEREVKYLIQVLPFIEETNNNKSKRFQFEVAPSKFPIISGLDCISRNEELIFDGKLTNTTRVLNDYKFFDHRACHLNRSNNIILADWISDCIRQEKYNIHFEAESDMNFWKMFDQDESDYFNKVKDTRKMP